jgi:hypothetical protein
VKASRAYIASLGTSGVLIGSFLLVLALVSAIFAFRGYPGEANNDGLDQLDVRHSRPAAATSEAKRQRASEAGERTAAGDRTGRRGGALGERAVGQSGGRGGVDGVRTHSGDAGGGTGAGSTPGGGGAGGAGLPLDPGGEGALPRAPSTGDLTDGLDEAVDNATSPLGDTVGRAAPQLEAPAVQAEETVGGVVEQAAPTVDEAVGGVTGKVGEVTGGLTGGGN